MAESARLLRGRGLISDKAWAARGHPAGTTSQKSKLANFSSGAKDEGRLGNKGIQEFDENSINKMQGGSAKYGRHVSKGAGIRGAEKTLTKRKELNDSSVQQPMFPKSKGGGKKWPGMHGGAGQQQGPMYGGPNSRKNSGVTGS